MRAERTGGRGTLVTLAARGEGPAGSPAPQRDTRASAFRSAADLVALSVTATGLHQQVIGDLTVENFIVFEEGIRQSIVYFAPERVPLDLAILLDTSTSMSPHLARAQEAAIGLARTLRPGDRTMVMGFHDRVDVLYPLGEQIPDAIDAVKRTKAYGGTALYNRLVHCDVVADRRARSAP